MRTLNLALVLITIMVLMGMGVYLVITEHYGWAWIPMLASGCMSYKETRDAAEDKQPEKIILEI